MFAPPSRDRQPNRRFTQLVASFDELQSWREIGLRKKAEVLIVRAEK